MEKHVKEAQVELDRVVLQFRRLVETVPDDSHIIAGQWWVFDKWGPGDNFVECGCLLTHAYSLKMDCSLQLAGCSLGQERPAESKCGEEEHGQGHDAHLGFAKQHQSQLH